MAEKRGRFCNFTMLVCTDSVRKKQKENSALIEALPCRRVWLLPCSCCPLSANLLSAAKHPLADCSNHIQRPLSLAPGTPDCTQ